MLRLRPHKLGENQSSGQILPPGDSSRAPADELSKLQTLRGNFQKRTLPVIAVVLAALALTVPFIKQPFNQDDRDFVAFAQAAAHKLPGIILHNYSYDGRFIPHYHDPHGPGLTVYLGMFLRAGTGASEALFHSLYLLFPVLGAVSMYFLGRRFTRYPLVAALLLVFTPAFLVLSHTLMDDAPGLALALAFAALYIYGVDRRDTRLLALSGGVMMIAALTAYETLTLVPALLFYGFLNGSKGLKRWLPFTMLAVAGIGWVIVTYKVYGRLPARSYPLRGSTYSWPGFTADGLRPDAILIALSGAAVFPLSLAFLFLWGKKNLVAGPLALGAALALVFFTNRTSLDKNLAQSIQVVFLTFTGMVIVYQMLFSGAAFFIRKNPAGRTELFLLAWFATTLGIYMSLLVPYVSVRHLLLVLPPVILLFVRKLDTLWINFKRLRTAFIWLTLFLTLAGGLAASIADYRSASVYPPLAQEMGRLYRQANGQGRKVYFRGELGFRYYMEQQGFTELNSRTQLHTGDLIIFSMLSSGPIPWPPVRYTEIWHSAPGDAFPVRVWNYWAGAGFYTNRMGALPIAISRATEDRIYVYEVRT